MQNDEQRRAEAKEAKERAKLQKAFDRLDKEAREAGFATEYERLDNPLSDNAYLYYIHHRIGWTNKLLEDIKWFLWVITALLTIAVFHYLGFF